MAKRQPEPWLPAPYDAQVQRALRALHTGTANEGQQQAALRWIVEVAAGAYDLSMRPGGLDGDRATAFAEGRRFVGMQIVKLLKIPVIEDRK